MPLPEELVQNIEAKIQAQVGRFLGLKAKLIKLRRSPSAEVRSQTEKLYRRQTLLEKELEVALQKIKNIKTGAYTMGDVLQVGAFATAMRRQVKDVEGLAAGTSMAKGLPIGWVPLTALIGVGLGLTMMSPRKGGKK